MNAATKNHLGACILYKSATEYAKQKAMNRIWKTLNVAIPAVLFPNSFFPISIQAFIIYV
jgi:hypothetical protein